MSGSKGKRIIKEIAVAGLEGFLKLSVDMLMEKRGMTKEDAELLVTGTLTEVGLGKLLPTPAKGNLDEASAIVDNISQNTSRGGLAKKAKLEKAVQTKEAATVVNNVGKTVNETVKKTASEQAKTAVEKRQEIRQ